MIATIWCWDLQSALQIVIDRHTFFWVFERVPLGGNSTWNSINSPPRMYGFLCWGIPSFSMHLTSPGVRISPLSPVTTLSTRLSKWVIVNETPHKASTRDIFFWMKRFKPKVQKYRITAVYHKKRTNWGEIQLELMLWQSERKLTTQKCGREQLHTPKEK